MTNENHRLERAEESGRWTVGALHDHIDQRFEDLEKRVVERFDSQEKATAAALVSAEKAVLKAENLATTRADAQNEFRGTIADIVHTMMPRSEYILAHAALVEKLGDIASRQSCNEGADRRTDTIVPWLIAAAGGIVAIISLLIDFTR